MHAKRRGCCFRAFLRKAGKEVSGDARSVSFPHETCCVSLKETKPTALFQFRGPCL